MSETQRDRMVQVIVDAFPGPIDVLYDSDAEKVLDALAAAGLLVVPIDDLPEVRRYPNPDDGPYHVLPEGRVWMDGKEWRLGYVGHGTDCYKRIPIDEGETRDD